MSEEKGKLTWLAELFWKQIGRTSADKDPTSWKVMGKGLFIPEYPKYLLTIELMEGLKQNEGTIVELYAGRGYFTKFVYSHLEPKRIIAVEKDKETLRRYRARVSKLFRKKETKVEIYNMDNIKWMKEVMPKLDLSDLVLVDFDASGRLNIALETFFDVYDRKGELRIRTTDGVAYLFSRFLLSREKLGRKIAKLYYPELCEEVDWRNKWTLEKHQILVDKYMKIFFKKHDLKLKWYKSGISHGFGATGSVYTCAIIER